MKTILYPNKTRGNADYGWLKANYSFSFGNYFDPEREQFGKLRVLNDDLIDPNKGFDTHAHRNMEIISIPLSGSLTHKDSLNHESVIKAGDIQVMSAGSGIQHSEYNASKTEVCNLLQLWIFPNKTNIKPRYDQKKFPAEAEINKFNTIVAPKDTSENALWIHQNAYLKITSLEKDKMLKYSLTDTNNGIYAFVISGNASIAQINLSKKDALAITEFEEIEIKAITNTRILIIETPL